MHMKSSFSTLFLILIVSSGVAQPVRYQVNPITPPVSIQRAIEKGTRTADGKPGAAYWQQYSHYTIRATVDEVNKTLKGDISIRYTNHSPDTLNNLHLDLYQNAHAPGAMRNEAAEITEGVTVSGVTVNGETLETGTFRGPRYVIYDTRMVVVPSRPVLPGSTAEISLSWSFEIPQAGAGGRMGYDTDDLFFLAYWYPQMTVYDDMLGWHPDPFKLNAEFYHGFADYDLEIHMPGDWIVLATGDLLNADQNFAPHVMERYNRAMSSDDVVNVITAQDFGDVATTASKSESLVWKFKSTKVRDVAVSITRASYWDSARTPTGNGYARINALYRDTAPLWKSAVRYSQHAITFLSKYTGIPYPWPHMTAVEAGNIIGGGMEYPMMTLIGDYNRSSAAGLQSVTAHELAHMWIPMIVSTDERRYSWIDEGFTTFHTNFANADFRDVERAHLGTASGYLRIAGTEMEGEMMRRSDYHYPGPAFGIASYNKPATVLMALRGVLGEETFREIYLDLLQTWAYKHMSPYDMFAFFNAKSGQDLTWFWRPWYYETGVLDQSVTSVYMDSSNRIDFTNIKLADLGQNPMPYLLRITLATGETHDEIIPIEKVLSSGGTINHTVPYLNVVKVEIDPEYHFPDKDRANNVWER